MRSGSFRVFAGGVALSMLSGCMFTQWTDHAYFGSPQDPPIHAEQEWAGVVILPVAIVGDVITAPFQVIALLIAKDYGIYSPPPRQRASLGIDAGEDAHGLRVAGIDADGNVTEIALTHEQQVKLAARLRDGTFDVAGAPLVALH